MANCGICEQPGHNALAHNVPCNICGQVKQFPYPEVKEAKDTHICGDVKAHVKIKRGFEDLTYEEVRLMKRHGVYGRPPIQR